MSDEIGLFEAMFSVAPASIPRFRTLSGRA
jgi:hypothetical protein